MWAAWIEYLEEDGDAALSHGRQALEIAERLGDSFSRAWAWYWVGLAHSLKKEWGLAIDSLERSVAISRERRTAVEGEPLRLAILAECHAGAGDPGRARPLAEEAVAIAGAREQPHIESFCSLSLARVASASSDAQDHLAAETALSRAIELAQATGTTSLEALMHAEYAKLARQTGSQELSQQELREAHRLFSEVGAAGQAERAASELALA
jgi:tetratricopeptide (TPR) repeat protein